MSEEKKEILDVCCGSRMFYFDKENPSVLFCDIREFEDTLCDGRKLEVKPDVIADFRDLPFEDNIFSLVVFDPPHMKTLGKNSWMAKKYGVLGDTWEDDIKQGFSECFRVLKAGSVLVFKWNSVEIPVSQILKLTNKKPLLGHKSGKRQDTHWILFINQ